jgi:hypothetical protein
MKKSHRILSASALVAMTCGLASASSINGTCTTAGPGPTELGSATPGLVSCTDFNTSLGTLTSIVLTITGDIVAPSSITLTNNDPTSHTGLASTDVTYSLAAPLTGFTFTNNAFGNLLDVLGSTGSQTLGSNASVKVNVTGTASTSSTNSTVGTFGGYEGAGSFTFTADTITSLVSTFGGGNVTIAQVTDADAKATVVYNYNAVTTGTPEPSTMLLFGSALVGLGLLRKRVSQQ